MMEIVDINMPSSPLYHIAASFPVSFNDDQINPAMSWG
jgi:hypothetical protein